MNHVETRVDANGQVSSSQEHIVDTDRSQSATLDDVDIDRKGGISKTVEFEFRESVV